MKQHSNKKYLIVGAGIAGLSLARQFKRLGIGFKLIEKQVGFEAHGSGIALPANAVKALRYMGLGDQIDALAHRVHHVYYQNSKGKPLTAASLDQWPLNRDHFIALKRNQLHSILIDGLESDIDYATQLQSMEETSEGIWATFDSSTSPEKFSGIIGADGLYSSVRQLQFGTIPLSDLGYTQWRWISSLDTTHLQPTYMLGRKEILMAYPISPTEVYCYAHVFDPDQIHLSAANKQEILKHLLQEFSGIAKILLQQLPDSSQIYVGRLRSMPSPLFQKGRVALVGDASNACSPLLQQGAAAAFEDTIALSKFLNTYDTCTALPTYENFRKTKVSWILSASDTPLKKIAQLNSPLAIFIRNLYLRIKGPTNVQGWKYLLKECMLEKLEENLH